jgi:hypothetical protein
MLIMWKRTKDSKEGVNRGSEREKERGKREVRKGDFQVVFI